MGFPFSVDIRRAREELGYRRVVSIDEGIRLLGRGRGLAPQAPRAARRLPDLRSKS